MYAKTLRPDAALLTWAVGVDLAAGAGRHVELEGAAVDGLVVVGDVELVEADLLGLVADRHRAVLVVDRLHLVSLTARRRHHGCGG